LPQFLNEERCDLPRLPSDPVPLLGRQRITVASMNAKKDGKSNNNIFMYNKKNEREVTGGSEFQTTNLVNKTQAVHL
jgi:hypothetical protein